MKQDKLLVVLIILCLAMIVLSVSIKPNLSPVSSTMMNARDSFLSSKELPDISPRERSISQSTFPRSLHIQADFPRSSHYTDHETIYVNNDAELAMVAVGGSGIKVDPYILEDWNITTSNRYEAGITIYNTSKYFIIRNCWIKTNMGRGIRVSHVGNGTTTVFNNTIYESDVGIDIYRAMNSTIANNTLQGKYGSSIENSDYSTIINNTFIGGGLQIHYFDSLEVILSYSIANNTVNGRPLGFLTNLVNVNLTTQYGQLILINGTNVGVQDQNCSFTSTGITVYYGSNYLLSNNTCNQNTGNGITLMFANSSTVTNNTANENVNGGFFFLSSFFVNITNNTANENGYYGMYYAGPSNFLNISSLDSILANNTISNNNHTGLSINYALNMTLVSNFIANNNYSGLSIMYSSSSTILNNTFLGPGLTITDFFDAYLSYNVTNNMVNGRPLGFFTNLVNVNLTTQYGQLILVNGTNLGVQDQNCSFTSTGITVYGGLNYTLNNNTCNHNTEYGILFMFANFSSVANNIAIQNQVGIFLGASWNSTLNNNTVRQNALHGIYIIASPVTIINNTISQNGMAGISFYYADNCVISGNTINQNQVGVSVSGNNYLIHHNFFVNNTGIGLSIYGNNNLIHHNFFINNTEQASSSGSNNQWYDSSTNEGNHWSDYSGIGSYQISGSAGDIDPYPLDEFGNVIPQTTSSSTTTTPQTSTSQPDTTPTYFFTLEVVLVAFVCLTLILWRRKNSRKK